MDSKEIYKALLDLKGTSENFTEFNQLTEYQKKRLGNVNFWRLKNGEIPINIPADFEKYWDDLETNLEADHGEDG